MMSKEPSKKTIAKKNINPSSKKDHLQTKIDKLLTVLNQPQTNSKFWRSIDEECHISGIRPVSRTTLEVINPNGFTPYDKKTNEKLFKYYNIDVVDSNTPYIMNQEDLEKKKKIENNGTIYLKHNDLLWLFDFIRNNA